MRSNHIPVERRLQVRIWGLELKLEGCWKKTRSRFYEFCRYCDADIISVNMRGHFKGCPVKGHEAQIRHYKALLNETKRFISNPRDP